MPSWTTLDINILNETGCESGNGKETLITLPIIIYTCLLVTVTRWSSELACLFQQTVCLSVCLSVSLNLRLYHYG